MQDILFIANDPLGNEIKLLADTFDKHIIVRHPEMKGRVDEIRRIIENPLYLGIGTKDKNSLIYLGKGDNVSYVVVAVKLIEKLGKIILTAFNSKNLGLNKLNKILWQAKKQKDFIIPTRPLRKK